MKSIYIAGPMSNLPEFNYPAFFRAEERLSQKWHVFNPARMDGMDTTGLRGHLSEVPEFSLRLAMQRNCAAICQCDAIYMLQGWQHSRGAKVELALAEYLGLEVSYEPSN